MGTFAWACICLCEHTYTYMYLRTQCISTMPAYTASKDNRKKRQLERSVAVSSPTKVYHDEGKVKTEKCSILTSKGMGHQCGGRESDFKKHFHFHSFAYQSPVNCLVTDLCHRQKPEVLRQWLNWAGSKFGLQNCLGAGGPRKFLLSMIAWQILKWAFCSHTLSYPWSSQNSR